MTFNSAYPNPRRARIVSQVHQGTIGNYILDIKSPQERPVDLPESAIEVHPGVFTDGGNIYVHGDVVSRHIFSRRRNRVNLPSEITLKLNRHTFSEASIGLYHFNSRQMRGASMRGHRIHIYVDSHSTDYLTMFREDCDGIENLPLLDTIHTSLYMFDHNIPWQITNQGPTGRNLIARLDDFAPFIHTEGSIDNTSSRSRLCLDDLTDDDIFILVEPRQSVRNLLPSDARVFVISENALDMNYERLFVVPRHLHYRFMLKLVSFFSPIYNRVNTNLTSDLSTLLNNDYVNFSAFDLVDNQNFNIYDADEEAPVRNIVRKSGRRFITKKSFVTPRSNNFRDDDMLALHYRGKAFIANAVDVGPVPNLSSSIFGDVFVRARSWNQKTRRVLCI